MTIVNKDSFQCAIDLISKKPVVLDFASSSNPGGSWRSKQDGTQEESLCRRSNLGLLLEKQKYPIANDSLIYLPNVIINKNIKGEKINPVKCSVIASEMKGISWQPNGYVRKRLVSLYETAIKNSHGVIVLGAWGCGAFGESDDDARILATEIKRLANDYNSRIETVCAVIGKNYKVFKDVFNDSK